MKTNVEAISDRNRTIMAALLIGGASVTAANLPTFLISQSVYYLMGTVAGLILTVTLLIPAVKRYLVGAPEATPCRASLSIDRW